MVAPTGEMLTVMSGVTDEHIEQSGKELYEMQERIKAEKAAREAVAEVDAVVADQLKALGL